MCIIMQVWSRFSKQKSTNLAPACAASEKQKFKQSLVVFVTELSANSFNAWMSTIVSTMWPAERGLFTSFFTTDEFYI